MLYSLFFKGIRAIYIYPISLCNSVCSHNDLMKHESNESDDPPTFNLVPQAGCYFWLRVNRVDKYWMP